MKIKTINSHCVAVYSHVSSGAGIRATVFSYDTPVFHIDENNSLHRLWDGWSATTQQDINKAFPGVNLTKKVWDSMPVETLEG